MGFYFRKSVNLGGLKFNSSKSGVGVSTGIKGFRIGSGPKGNYVQIGRNGIYYKRTCGNLKKNANENNKIKNIEKYNKSNYIPKSNDEDLDEYNTEEICDSSSVELIEEIKNKYSKITLKWFSLLFLFNIYLFILSFIIFAYLDYKRKNTIIFYDIDGESEAKLQQFYDSFGEITNCKRKWYILSKNYNFDSKYNAGASSLVNRKDIIIENKIPKYIKTNIKIPCVPVGNQKLYFFPDKILIIEGKKVGALSYKNLGISVTNGNFIETEMKPLDGTVVDYTYKYVNKGGGPDRRFANNPRYPIMRYSYINFYGDNGFNECIMLSKQGVGNILKEKIGILQSQKILEKDNSIKENRNDKLNEVINSTEKFKNKEISNNIKSSNENILENYNSNEIDPLLVDAIDLVIQAGYASTPFIQRKFKIGYTRSARIIEQMEENDIISGYQENKQREVLMTKEKWEQLKNSKPINLKVSNSAFEENKVKIKENVGEKNEKRIEEQIGIKDKKKNMFYKK